MPGPGPPTPEASAPPTPLLGRFAVDPHFDAAEAHAESTMGAAEFVMKDVKQSALDEDGIARLTADRDRAMNELRDMADALEAEKAAKKRVEDALERLNGVVAGSENATRARGGLEVREAKSDGTLTNEDSPLLSPDTQISIQSWPQSKRISTWPTSPPSRPSTSGLRSRPSSRSPKTALLSPAPTRSRTRSSCSS